MPFLLPILLFAAAANPYDIVIRNGRIIDGTGSPCVVLPWRRRNPTTRMHAVIANSDTVAEFIRRASSPEIRATARYNRRGTGIRCSFACDHSQPKVTGCAPTTYGMYPDSSQYGTGNECRTAKFRWRTKRNPNNTHTNIGAALSALSPAADPATISPSVGRPAAIAGDVVI